MSAKSYTTIWCDASEDERSPNCFFLDEEGSGSRTAKDGRRVAKHRGWAVGLPGGRDLCPACAFDGHVATPPPKPGLDLIPIYQVPIQDLILDGLRSES